MARGLALRPADARGEEFPLFRAFWIERPNALSDEIVAHALLDSESACGAYRFTIRPREETIIDVECTIFARNLLDHVGYGGIAGMFLLGAQSHRIDDDVRPEVHDANGLQLHTGQDESIWRPVTNPETLQISVFSDQNPKGFGLLQRLRDPLAYQDQEKASSGGHRSGSSRSAIGRKARCSFSRSLRRMRRTPTFSPIWRPKAQIAAGSQTSFALRQFWTWSAPDRPDDATVQATRTGHGSAPNRRRFIVEFSSSKFTDHAAIAGISAAASTSKGKISDIRLTPMSNARPCALPSSSISAARRSASCISS